jgi:hypothetical protein
VLVVLIVLMKLIVRKGDTKLTQISFITS